MKFVRFQHPNGKVSAGEWVDGTVYQLDAAPEAIFSGEVTAQRGASVADATLLAPTMPGKLLCVGRNYAEHAAELNNDLPEQPLIFAKFPTSIIANGDTVQWLSSVTSQVDWEGELTVVIGKTASNITEEEAENHIFGYTIANDISARDLQARDGQWARAKGADTFCPLGPVIVTRDEIEDVDNLRIQTVVNGKTMQDGNTRDLIFKIPFLVSYLSKTFTLNPGDIILTGTPSGVGKAQKPPVFLQDGDAVSVTIDGIGTLENTCKVLS